ncbi:MAG TPA: hypothetical protein VJ302_23360 [Blastocatellia bacterium]|nr:hypothetical protein [Blastocatellia bacterium]
MNSSPTDNILAFGWGSIVALYSPIVLDAQTVKGLLLILANFAVPVATRFCILWMKDYFEQKRERRLQRAERATQALAEKARTESAD